jgi:hypothetical protein
MKKSTKKFMWKYWGYGALLVLIFGWFVAHFGPIPLIGLSMLVTVYMLLQAPVPCCARNRDGTFCRNRGRGVFGGCKQVAQHRWQNAKLLIERQSWAQLVRGLFRGVGGQAAAISALAGSLSAVAATIALVIKK